MAWLTKHWLSLLANILALLPLALLILDYASGGLGFDPIREVTLRTGFYALILLILSLACTPLNILFGLRQVIPLRRTLGLYAFGYASLHFLTFIWLDYGLDPALIYTAIFEQPYALVGFAAFLILLPLAITSTKGWMRRLGKNWKRLHQGVYLAAILVILHFAWLVKGDLTEPLIYGVIVGVLLLIRLPTLRKRITAFRHKRTRQRSQA